MSKQIDERVVSMQFDNAQFEKNVSTTMSTLEKLKQSLNLNGAARGFEDIGGAVKKVDMRGLASGVETVGLKFQAMYSIADQTLRNITTKVQNAAENMVKSLTVQPVTTGFNEYELKMGSIQTIMASTGESLDTVNKYLNELNEYSDQTIYSFSDMTQNIGKFTNAGVKLEDAVMAIKGISNEAAVSGANANEASRAMYNFAQALSAGFVKLIDWKSIENANMATVEFKNQLIAAAVEAKTLEKTADGMYKVLTTNTQGSTFNNTIDATHFFNDSLNYQWMTTEVLVNTLKDYANETTDIGRKAKAAATEIKTFTMMMDTLKESAQSGWATTWEILVGDFETAKRTWTIVGNAVGDVINKMSDARNSLLKGAFQNSGWDKFVAGITEAGISTKDLEESMRNVLERSGRNVDELIEKHGSLEEVFRKEKGGIFYLQRALVDLNSKLVDLSDIEGTLKKGATGDDVKKIQQALKEAGYQCGEFGENLDGVDGKLGEFTVTAIKAFQAANGLDADGIIGPKTLKALKEANKVTSKLDKNIAELAYGIRELGGRELLMEGLKNILEVIKDIIEAIGKAWDNVFDAFDSSDLFTIIERFHKFTTELSLNEDVANDITSTFEGLFKVLKFVKDTIVTVVSVGAKLVWTLFKPLGTTVLSVTAAIGDFIKSGGDMLSNVFEPIGKVADDVIGIIGELLVAIGEFISDGVGKLSELEFIKTVGEWFSESATNISDAVSDIRSKINEIGGIKIDGFLTSFTSFFNSIDDWWASFKGSERGTVIIEGFLAPFKAVWDWITSINLPKFSFDGFLDSFYKFFKYLQTNDFSGFIGTIKGTFDYLKYTFFSSKWSNFENNAIQAFSNFWIQNGGWITDAFNKAKKAMKAMAEFIFSGEEINLKTILQIGKALLEFAILYKTLHIVEDISGSLDSIATAFRNIGAGVKWRAIGAAFLSLAAVLATFAICMKIIESIESPEAAWRSMGILLIALTAMGAIVGGLIFLSSKIKGGVNIVSSTFALVAIAASLALLVYTLKKIDDTDFRHLGSSFAILIGVMTTLTIAMAVIGKTCSGANLKSAAALFTLLTTLSMVLNVLDAYAEYDWNSVLHIIPTMMGALIGLALVLRLATSGIKAGANTAGLTFLMIGMMLSLKILLNVVAEFGAMPKEQLDQGCVTVLVLLALITKMLGWLNKTNPNIIAGKGQKSINGFTGLATALLAVAATIAILGSLPTNVLIKGGLAVTTILTLFTAMMSIIGKSMANTIGFGKITGVIIGMGVLLAELAIIMYLIRNFDTVDAVAKFGGIAAVLVAIALCMRAIPKADVKMGTIGKWVVVMIAMVGLVAAIAYIMNELNKCNIDGKNALAQFGAISMILIVMAACLKSIPAVPMLPSNMSSWLAAMGSMVLIIAGLGIVMKVLHNWNIDGRKAAAQFGAISIMLIAMSACIAILSFIPPGGAIAAASGLGALGIFAIALAAFMGALGELDLKTDGKAAEAFDRAVGMITKMGEALGGFIAGFGAGLLSTLPQMGECLSGFMDSASVFFAGLKDMNADMVKNTAIMVAAIGELNAIAGDNSSIFGVSEKLPNLGTSLSGFMNNAADFFSGLYTIDASMAEGTKTIAEAIGILAEAASIDTSNMKSGFTSLGDSLVPFGESMVAFSDTISGKIDTGAIEAAAAAGHVMAELNAALPKEYGAIAGLFASSPIPLDTFGGQLVQFGKAMVEFSKTVSAEGAIDTKAIETAKSAAQLMSELNNALPKEYGAISALFASSPISLDTFGGQLVLFGRAMVSFSRTVSAEGAIDTAAVETAKNAGMLMTELANNLPTEPGGLVAWFKDNPISLDTFGSQLAMFGRAMVSFSRTVSAEGAINKEAIENAKNAGLIMTELANGLPTETSWWDKWFGDGGKMNMETFGTQIKSFGEAMAGFSKSVSGTVDTSTIKIVTSVANDLVDLANTLPEEIDLTTLKDGLTQLSEAMIAFSETVTGKVDNETVTSVVNAAKTLAQAAAIMPAEVDISKLTTGLGDFGTAIVSFSEQVSGAVDGGSVTTAAQAGKDIAAMLATIPQGIDPTNFIDNLGKLGTALVDFSTAVAGSEETGGIDTMAMAAAQTACDYLGNMFTSLSMYVDVTDFLNNADALAQAIINFSNTMSGTDGTGAINLNAMASAMSAASYIGSIYTHLANYVDVTDFIDTSASLAQAIIDFSTAVSGENVINTANIDTAVTAATRIADIITTCGVVVDISGFIDNTKALATALNDFSANVAGTIVISDINTAYSAATVISNIISKLSAINDIASTVSLIDDLGTAIVDFATTVSSADVTGISEDCEAFKSAVESFGNLSESGVEAFIENLSGAKMKTIAAISTFCNSVVTATRSYVHSFKLAGSYIVSGFASGITENTFKARAAASAMAMAALQSAKAALDENSPSKEFYRVGAYAGEGFVNAFSDYESVSSKAGSGMAKSALLGLKDAIGSAKDFVENGIDTQPTIRPVLDLSGVQADASMITSLFDTNPSVGVMANVGAISRGMAYGQNGSTNDDVINAINGLRDSMSRKTGDTYTIGNITYDDGTEVSNAIKTLVRAARVERRT